MIGWLKDILGDSYTDEIDKQVSKKIGESYVSKTDFNEKNESNKQLKQQLETRDQQLAELKKVDAAGLQAKITELEQANTTAATEYENKLAAFKLDAATDKSILAAHGKNTTAIKSLINREALKLKDDKVEGIEAELKRVQADAPYLFEEIQKKPNGGAGSAGGSGGTGDDSSEPPEDFAAYEAWRSKH